jgi:hypothetical protein
MPSFLRSPSTCPDLDLFPSIPLEDTPYRPYEKYILFCPKWCLPTTHSYTQEKNILWKESKHSLLDPQS